jgi:hypothetical protein
VQYSGILARPRGTRRTLRAGDQVRFELADSERGAKAVDVALCD